jgi:predicted SnoaL-like aldol condensation-catalyzing enzyme
MTVQSKAEIASQFLTLCAGGRVREAFDLYVAEKFQHHNPYFNCDRHSLLVAMEESARTEPTNSFTIQQIIESPDRVAVLSHLLRKDDSLEYAVVHILRFQDGKIAELWDIAQELSPGSPNTLGMF